jgi:hypothetical protein
MDTSEMVELSQEFAALGAELHGDGDNDAALHRMVELAVKHVGGCSWASITVVRGTNATTLAASDPIAALADSLQYELEEGPCLQAAEDDANYLLFDVETESRWPRFAQALAERTRVRSVLSFQLEAEDSAALNLFAEEAGAFSNEDIDTGIIFAAHASSLVALHEAEDQAANLQAALDNSREIGAALGILMAHHKITQDDAFLLLRAASQKLHIKVRELAADVVQTGTLPER